MTVMAPVPSVAPRPVPCGPERGPDSASAEVPGASAVNDDWRSGVGSLVDTPGAPKSGIAVQVAFTLPPTLSMLPVTQMTRFSPVVTNPESVRLSSRTILGSNVNTRS